MALGIGTTKPSKFYAYINLRLSFSCRNHDFPSTLAASWATCRTAFTTFFVLIKYIICTYYCKIQANMST